jgi:hypothetical protein
MSRLDRVLPLVLSALLVAACGLADGDALAAGPSEPTTTATATTPPPTRGPTAIPPRPSTIPDPSPAVTATPTPTPTPTAAPQAAPAAPAPVARLESFAMNLYRKGDFVPQYTFEWCVGASLQMMRNLTDAKVTRARATQQRYWELARDLSFSPFGGANPRGWTAALNELGHGPYDLVSVPDYDEALRVAARAMRDTGRPVGLVMWRGRHAWVMSGFASKGDPASDKAFRVTGVRVLDPLYPHGNRTWGASPKPNTLLTPARLAKQFVRRDSRRVNLGVPPGYLLILPVDAPAA